MREVSRRGMLGLGMGAVASLTAVGCSSGSDKAAPKRTAQAKPIGDGSTSRGVTRPKDPKPERLERGQKPPQFVVFSWDGAGEVGNGLFPRFRKIAEDHGATMTFFLSGLYCLPESKKSLYKPPNNPVGASDIGYLTDDHIKATLDNVRRAWLEGHEIGTHFNGHFCTGRGSGANWTSAQWESEIEQAVSFVTQWRTNTGFKDVDPLPFDYREELIGGRTPCLLGQQNLLPTARKLGWRYDASSPGGRQVWPTKKMGLWDYPLQQIPFPGHSFEVLSMDYNILANQSQNSTNAPPANYPGWRKQATDAYISGFQRAYESNRAPFFIGNHFEKWNGGIYMDAVEEALKHMADEKRKDVRLVSFKQLTDWMDAQDPAVLTDLRRFGVGEAWSASSG